MSFDPTTVYTLTRQSLSYVLFHYSINHLTPEQLTSVVVPSLRHFLGHGNRLTEEQQLN